MVYMLPLVPWIFDYYQKSKFVCAVKVRWKGKDRYDYSAPR